MLGGELARRSENLKKEQRQRAEAAQRKADKEKIIQERLQKQREAHEEELRLKRIAEAAAAEQERLKHEEAVEANNGVWWSARLRVVPLDESAAAQKGIKRGADKVLLPPSVGEDLMRQDAPKNGAQLFEIASTSGRTHAGVLDFTAVEGTIAVPPLVARNLFGPEAGASQDRTVAVTYRRLQKGEYARFQPRAAGFQQAVEGDVRGVLEAALARHSTLTQGDWISVSVAGQEHELLVQKTRPGAAISVIDTELEAEVEPSLETEQRLVAEEAAREEAARKQEAELGRLAREALAQAAEAERQRAQQEADLERLRQEKGASLPPEPPADESATTACLIRLPNGARFQRRFRISDPLPALFDFLDAQDIGSAPGTYSLVTQFPRRVIQISQFPDKATFADAGLTGRQEALLLEPAH
ncbi:g12764 [Coccomyxa viridis]|uniref:G12764 protein n=1 Tax=Coccomyxa viridis TaxID=1274662 RepID=A0ABP1GB57_9CHLO